MLTTVVGETVEVLCVVVLGAVVVVLADADVPVAAMFPMEALVLVVLFVPCTLML
jgi:hypothetical protein